MPISTLFNSFDMGTQGFALNYSGGKSGTRIDVYNQGSGAGAAWLSATQYPAYSCHGIGSLQISTSVSGGNCTLQWYGPDLSTKTIYDRFYFMFPVLPPNEITFRYFAGDVAASWIGLTPTGQIFVSGANVKYYSATTIVPGKWYRIESQHVYSATGYIQARLYSDMDSETPSDYISTNTFNYNNASYVQHYLGIFSGSFNGQFLMGVDEWVVTNEYNWIGPWKPTEPVKQNSFEGGTPGTPLSYSNTGGPFNSPITTVTIPAGNNINIDNSRAAHGSNSVYVVSNNGAGRFGWTGRTGNLTPGQPLYCRFYIYVTALPAGYEYTIQEWDLWGSIGQMLYFDPVGKFRLYMHSVGSTLCTTPKGITTNTWYRVEVKGQATAVAAPVAGGEIRVYVGDSQTLYTSAVSTYNYSSNASMGYSGIQFTGHSYCSYYVDDFAVSATDWIGPYVPPLYVNSTDTVAALADSQALTIADLKLSADTALFTEPSTDLLRKLLKESTDRAKFAERTIPNVPKKIGWKTELALASTPNDAIASQVWTDVSGYVLETSPTSLRRGRSDEMSDIQPSSLSMTLDNTDGRFTPGYTAGPYGTNIDMGKMIRRSAVIDGVSYPRFTGYIDTVNIPEWANSNHFHRTVSIEASDRLARIGAERAGPMLSAYEYEVLRLDPELFYPMTEEADAQTVSNRSTYRFDPLIRVQNAGETTMGGGDSWPAENVKTAKFEPVFQENGNLLASSDWFRGELRNPIPYGSGSPVTICAWVTVDQIWTAGTLNLLPRIAELKSDTQTVFLGLNAQGMWTGGAAGASASTAPVSPGTGTGPRFVAVVINPGNAVALYVDGQLYPGSGVPVTTDQLYIMAVGGPWAGSIGGVAVFRQALSTAQIQKLYQAGYTGTDGLLSDEAMRSVADYAGISTSELAIDPPRGQTRVGKIPMHGRSRLDVMRDIVKAEGGLLFADPSGVIQFHTRGKRWNTGAAQLVIPPQEIKVTLAINYDDTYIINEAYVSRDGGVTARAVWLPSQNLRGIYTKSVDGLKFFSDAEAMPRARSYVIQNNAPKPRMGALPFDVATSLIQKYLLQLDIGSIISFSGLSADAPNFGRHFVEGITESQSADEYTITVATSPVYAPLMAYMVVGESWLSQIGGYNYIAP